MTIVITTYIFCDGCTLWLHGTTTSKPMAFHVKGLAKKAGWLIMPNGHITCPKCNGTDPDYWKKTNCGDSLKCLTNNPPPSSTSCATSSKTSR